MLIKTFFLTISLLKVHIFILITNIFREWKCGHVGASTLSVQKREAGNLELELQVVGCKLTCECWKWNTGPLEDQ